MSRRHSIVQGLSNCVPSYFLFKTSFRSIRPYRLYPIHGHRLGYAAFLAPTPWSQSAFVTSVGFGVRVAVQQRNSKVNSPQGGNSTQSLHLEQDDDDDDSRIPVLSVLFFIIVSFTNYLRGTFFCFFRFSSSDWCHSLQFDTLARS